MKIISEMKEFFVGVLCILVGIVFLAGSFITTNISNSYYGKGVVTAVITSVSDSERMTQSDITSKSQESTTRISYEINGIEYQNVELTECQKTMKIGDSINVSYNVEEPTEVSVAKTNVATLLIRVISMATIFLGVFETVYYFLRKIEIC